MTLAELHKAVKEGWHPPEREAVSDDLEAIARRNGLIWPEETFGGNLGNALRDAYNAGLDARAHLRAERQAMSTLKTPLRNEARLLLDADGNVICALWKERTAAEISLAYNYHARLRDALLRQLHNYCTCDTCESSRTLLAEIDAAEAQLTTEER